MKKRSVALLVVFLAAIVVPTTIAHTENRVSFTEVDVVPLEYAFNGTTKVTEERMEDITFVSVFYTPTCPESLCKPDFTTDCLRVDGYKPTLCSAEDDFDHIQHFGSINNILPFTQNIRLHYEEKTVGADIFALITVNAWNVTRLLKGDGERFSYHSEGVDFGLLDLKRHLDVIEVSASVELKNGVKIILWLYYYDDAQTGYYKFGSRGCYVEGEFRSCDIVY